MNISKSTLITTALGLSTAIALSAALIGSAVYSITSGSLYSLYGTTTIIG